MRYCGVVAAALSGLSALAISACTVGETHVPITFEEFRSQLYQEPDTGVFIVNGDELAETPAQLWQAYVDFLNSYQAAQDRAEGIGTAAQGLIVNTVNGADDKWNATAAVNITYCVDTRSFGTRHGAVVTAMAEAAGDWEGTRAKIDFIYLPGEDGRCNTRNNAVVFNVRQVRTPSYIARAFFPSSSRRSREVLISTSAYGDLGPWTLRGILRHELGHTIGLRHEHTRPESGTCFENTSWRALTEYDAASVMHYPHCNGTQEGDLVLTDLDVRGVRALYP